MLEDTYVKSAEGKDRSTNICQGDDEVLSTLIKE
jgi:hypothetical protein